MSEGFSVEEWLGGESSDGSKLHPRIAVILKAAYDEEIWNEESLVSEDEGFTSQTRKLWRAIYSDACKLAKKAELASDWVRLEKWLADGEEEGDEDEPAPEPAPSRRRVECQPRA